MISKKRTTKNKFKKYQIKSVKHTARKTTKKKNKSITNDNAENRRIRDMIQRAREICPKSRPLFNPNTQRCVKDTITNRLRLGILDVDLDGQFDSMNTQSNSTQSNSTQSNSTQSNSTQSNSTQSNSKSNSKSKSKSNIMNTRSNSKKPSQNEISKFRAKIQEAEEVKYYGTMGWLVHIFKKYTGINNKTKINFLEKVIDTHNNKWEGYPSMLIMGIIYLLMKHKQSCFILNDFATPGMSWTKLGFEWVVYSEEHYKTLTYREKIGTKKYINNKKTYYAKLNYPDTRLGLKNSISNCMKKGKDYIIIFVGIEYEYSDNEGKQALGHQNVMLFNVKRKEIEFFEPHGVINYGDDKFLRRELYNAIDIVFIKEDIPYNLMYYPMDYCPIGPQVYDNHTQKSRGFFRKKVENVSEGYCASWSLYYIDARLSNPTIDRKELISTFVERYKHESIYFINSYANFILILFDDIFKDVPELFIKLRNDVDFTKKEQKDFDIRVSGRLIKMLSML
jgi:hypothetical protein